MTIILHLLIILSIVNDQSYIVDYILKLITLVDITEGEELEELISIIIGCMGPSAVKPLIGFMKNI